MRDRILQMLLLAMVFAEALRGISDVLKHISKGKAAAKDDPTKWCLPVEHSRFRQWAALAFVCALAIVPTLYYTAHAALA